jgi:hypothetical protein
MIVRLDFLELDPWTFQLSVKVVGMLRLAGEEM